MSELQIAQDAVDSLLSAGKPGVVYEGYDDKQVWFALEIPERYRKYSPYWNLSWNGPNTKISLVTKEIYMRTAQPSIIMGDTVEDTDGIQLGTIIKYSFFRYREEISM